MMRSQSFLSIHRQGFVRVAGCTPRVHVGDPKANADETLALMRDGESRHVALAIFPELGISAYAIDDLLLQDALLNGVEDGLRRLVEASRDMRMVSVVGAPVRRNQRLYNCAVVIARGKILGVVPKSFLPNYREYYENRWFAPGVGVAGLEVDLAGQHVAFGTDLLFGATDLPDFTFHVEICEDFWSATPPSTMGALAGAAILCNLSASNVVIGKAEERATLCASQSVRCHAAYVYSASGPGESTTDLAWDGQAPIQVQGLMKRLQSTNGERIVIGVSGGLDSTHALLVAVKAFDELGLPRKNILGFTLPGFATSEGTKSNAWALMNALGITGEEIDIRPTATRMLQDLGHPFAKGDPVYDVTFENVQAGLRTDYLFRLANQRKAFVLGTGDLSELALGWCTYGVGDHMSHYNG